MKVGRNTLLMHERILFEEKNHKNVDTYKNKYIKELSAFTLQL